MPVGDPLWTWSWKCGCSTQQLCSAPFCQPPHELAPLYVGDRSFGRALHHGRGAFFPCRVADGVSGHQCDADGADDHYSAEPPALENEIGCECRGAGSSSGRSADPETDFPDLRRKRGSGYIFLLLLSGADHQSVGQQLSGAEQGNRAGDRRRLCQSFLCRHHRGTGVVRLPDLKIR